MMTPVTTTPSRSSEGSPWVHGQSPVHAATGTPYKVQWIDLDVTDGNVTLEAGQTNEYTMMNWMSIVPK